MPSSQAVSVKGIRLHLAARNKNQTWLAEQIGRSPFWVSRRMSSTQSFNVDDLDAIAAVFGTTTEGLLASAEAVAS